MTSLPTPSRGWRPTSAPASRPDRPRVGLLPARWPGHLCHLYRPAGLRQDLQSAAGKACCAPEENLHGPREKVCANRSGRPRLRCRHRPPPERQRAHRRLRGGGRHRWPVDSLPPRQGRRPGDCARRRACRRGQSGRTTAQITCTIDKGYAETERLRGADGARLAAATHSAAIDEIERTVRDEQKNRLQDSMRVDGYLFCPRTSQPRDPPGGAGRGPPGRPGRRGDR